MPNTTFVLYAEARVSPVIEWLDTQPAKVKLKVTVGIKLLETLGHEARRPLWAPLRDGIYELRIRHLNVHYRLLSFFHEGKSIVAAHGCTKKGAVDDADIDRAISRMLKFKANPAAHIYKDVPSHVRRQ